MENDVSPTGPPEEVWVPEAARMLGVSPGHVEKLLAFGLLQHRTMESRPRLRREDLAAYKATVDRRHAFLDGLMMETEELGLY